MDSKHGRKPRWVIRWIKGKKVFREVKYCWLLSRMRPRSLEWKSTVSFLKVGGNDNYCSEFKNECRVGEGSSSVFPHLHCTLHTHTSAHTHAHTYTHTRARAHTHMHTHTHKRTHTRTHMHIHIQINEEKFYQWAQTLLSNVSV
jgi:hypothetical protein